MPVYKDEKRGTWYCSFYFTDWNGVRKKKKKSGFKLQREAKDFETDFLAQHQQDPTMSFKSLLELYNSDLNDRTRESTKDTKNNMIDTHILPFFKNYAIDEISPTVIRNWQNEMLSKTKKDGKPYSPTYLRSINSQLTAILNYAVKYQGLPINPCDKVDAIGKKKAKEMQFWTLDEFNQFISYEKRPAYHLCFNILFWCGLRIGECLALKPDKINKEDMSLEIYETYHRKQGKDIFGPTKTDNGFRNVTMPKFIYDELTEYVSSLYGLTDNDKIFYFSRTALNKEMENICKISGVKKIRVHDLRHSHVSLLINIGYKTHAIAKRIGDTPAVVDRTYAHLYPDVNLSIAKELNKHKDGFLL